MMVQLGKESFYTVIHFGTLKLDHGKENYYGTKDK
jgi:hypothetical protein